MIRELLSKFNLNYEDLTDVELETLRNWLDSLSKNELTVLKIQEYIRSMLSAVEKEISQDNLPKAKDAFLKARMRNYLMLLDFLEAPEKAKKFLENQLKNLK